MVRQLNARAHGSYANGRESAVCYFSRRVRELVPSVAVALSYRLDYLSLLPNFGYPMRDDCSALSMYALVGSICDIVFFNFI